MKNFLLLSFLIIFVLLSPFLRKKTVVYAPERISVKKITKITNKNNLHRNLLKSGYPFITNYQLNINAKEQIWTILQDNDGAMLFGGNKGVVVFDGIEMDLVKLNTEPLVMVNLDDSEKILLGCDNDYGYMEKNNKGLYKFTSLSVNQIQVNDITGIEITDSSIYFYSKSAILKYEKQTLNYQNSWIADKDTLFEGIIKNANQIYLKKQGVGLLKINKEDELIPIRSDLLKSEEILFNLNFLDNKTIIGTNINNLYLFNDEKIEKYSIDFEKYLKNNQLVGGLELTDSLFVLSTVSGGAIIVNKKTGNAKYKLNYQTGLPDDEIMAIGKDNSGALWVSHEFGISRINYNLPVYNYTAYQGLEGRLVDVIPFDNTLYMATTQGLFYLDTLISVKESEVFVKKRFRVKVKKQNNVIKPEKKELKSNTVIDKVEKEQPKKKKSAFERRQERKKKRLLKRLKAQGVDVEVHVDEKKNEKKKEKPITVYEQKYKTRYVKQKKYNYENLGYIYKKIEGIDFKCRQLITYNDYLLVASINGLYIIKNNETQELLKNVYINQITPASISNAFYLATEKGVKLLIFRDNKWELINDLNPKGLNDNILTVIEDEDHNLWLSSSDVVYKLLVDENFNGELSSTYDLPGKISENIITRKIQGKLFFIVAEQIFSYNSKKDKIEFSHQLIPDSLILSNLIFTQSDITWFKTKEKWVCVSDFNVIAEEQLAMLNVFNHINNIKIDDENNLWVIDDANGVYKIQPTTEHDLYLNDFQVFFSKIRDKDGERFPLDEIEFEYKQRSFTFTIAAPFYVKQGAVEYQYIVEGVMNDWSDWRPRSDFDFIISNPGTFVVKVRARNAFGGISETKQVVFRVKAPFWLTTWFLVLMFLVSLFLIVVIVMIVIKKREQKLLKEKMILEKKVKERTIEISKQKEEIERKNIEITDSIYYARNIQSAVMPPISLLDKIVSNYFMINKPRDIVSGDYYWFVQKDDKIVITVADCTGHGVPGAFLSMLGMSALRDITNNMYELQANNILNELREKIIDSLHQTGDDDERKDGMDMSLCVLDMKNLTLQYSGAYNPLYIARNGSLEVLKGDRMPIGIHSNISKSFTGYEIDLQKGDTFYLFSDGFVDQFGGEFNRKFLSKNFRKLLTEIQDFDLQTQKELILQTFDMWKGDEIQIDDILILAVEI